MVTDDMVGWHLLQKLSYASNCALKMSWGSTVKYLLNNDNADDPVSSYSVLGTCIPATQGRGGGGGPDHRHTICTGTIRYHVILSQDISMAVMCPNGKK